MTGRTAAVIVSFCEELKQWHHCRRRGGADRPGWHLPGGDTRMNFFCGWIYKEHWTNDVGRRTGWEWWRETTA